MSKKKYRNRPEIQFIKDFQKNNQSWDELTSLYDSIASGIVEVADKLNLCIATIRQHGFETNVEMITTTNAIKNDLNMFTGELLKIKSSHEGRTGRVRDGDDLALCLTIFNHYNVLYDRFRAIIFPSMLTITEFLTQIQSQQLEVQNGN